MSRILVACPNLSLDRTVKVESLVPGHVHRTRDSDARGGGKGVNVARALACVGIDSEVVGFTGGYTGRAVAGMLADEGIALHRVQCDGESRSCVIIVAGGQVTVLNEDGPSIDEAVWERFETRVCDFLPGATILVCSGSYPPGAPPDAAARLIRAGRAAGTVTICDTSRIHLEHALVAAPDVLTPNLAEATSVLGGASQEEADGGGRGLDAAAAAATALVSFGPRTVIVTAGGAGAAIATGEETMTLEAAPVKVRNPIGAGDCLVAGVAAELAAGARVLDAAKRGMAMAAASCETFVAGMVDPRRARELAQWFDD